MTTTTRYVPDFSPCVHTLQCGTVGPYDNVVFNFAGTSVLFPYGGCLILQSHKQVHRGSSLHPGGRYYCPQCWKAGRKLRVAKCHTDEVSSYV